MVMLVFACIPASAQGTPSQTERLLDLSGLTLQLSEIVQQTKVGLEDAASEVGLPSASLDVMRTALNDVLDPAALLSAIDYELQTRLSAADIEQLLLWYESGVGRRITQAEERASTADAQLEIKEQSAALMRDFRRVAYAIQLDQLLGTTDFAMSQAVNVSLISLTAIMSTANPNARVNLDVVRAGMGPYEREVRPTLEKLTVLSYVYAYRDLSFSDLELYQEFLSTPESTKFHAIIEQTVDSQFELAAERLAERIAELSN